MNQLDDKGERHGYWEHYFNNKELSSKGTYINGLKNGYWEEYFLGGNIWWKGHFKNNFPTDYWVIYGRDGELNQKIFSL